jgi:hypothetical protein
MVLVAGGRRNGCEAALGARVETDICAVKRINATATF